LIPRQALPREQDIKGPLAQLGERLHGMQEVSGSIPLGSTNFSLYLLIADAVGVLREIQCEALSTVI
jgi:hypothetical protein